MNIERWPEIAVEFERLRVLPAAERKGALPHIEDAAVRLEVAGLLASYDECGDFLEQPALAIDPGPFGGLDVPPALQGKVFGRFRLIRQIGEGGMGTVFAAERADGEFQQRAAVKIIRAGFATDQHLERFRRERQILAGLNHANIARLFDGGTTDEGLPYLVMELIEGEHLDCYCAGRPLDERLRLFQDMCAAVDFAPQRQILHRDLKPSNILVTPGGEVKLLDFGIAKSLDTDADLTKSQAVASPLYASPEQLRGLPATAATDVYSLGVVLYELVTGSHPFARPAAAAHEISAAICENRPRRPSAFPGVSPVLDRIVLQAMNKHPSARYASAKELSSDISRFLAGQRVSAAAPPARPGRVKLLIAACGMLVLAVAGYYAAARRTHPAPSLAVVRFENLSGDASLDWLDRGMSELLTTSLAQSQTFQVISTERVRRALVPGSNATDAARGSGADLFVSGTLLKKDAGLRLDLRTQETSTGKVLYAASFEGPDGNSVFSLADRAAAGMAEQFGRPRTASVPVTQVMTSNRDALEAYQEGRRLMDRWRHQEAVKALLRAIELDAKFVMAHIALAEISGPWNPAQARKRLAIAAGLAARQPLPPFQRRMLQAQQLGVDGRLEDASATLASVIQDFPQETAPLLLRAIYELELGRFAAALKHQEEVTRIDARDPNAPLLAAYTSALTGNYADAERWAKRYCSLVDSGDWNCPDVWGDIYARQHRFADAIQAYASYRGKWNQSELKQSFLALNRGRFDEAAEHAKLAQANYPHIASTRPISLFCLGNAEVGRQHWDAAVDYFEQSARAYSWNPSFRFDQLFKAAQIYLELGKPEKVLELASRHETPWLPALRAMAYAAMGKTAHADKEYQALRASLTPVLGPYMALRTERLYRVHGEFYAGNYQQSIAFAAGVPVQLRSMYALPLARSYLKLGNRAEARRQLEFLEQFRWLQGPTQYERYSAMTFGAAVRLLVTLQ